MKSFASGEIQKCKPSRIVQFASQRTPDVNIVVAQKRDWNLPHLPSLSYGNGPGGPTFLQTVVVGRAFTPPPPPGGGVGALVADGRRPPETVHYFWAHFVCIYVFPVYFRWYNGIANRN